MAELPSDPLQRPLPDGTVPEPVVIRTEEHWVTVMVAMLAIMMVIMVLTSFVGALHPASNVEVIDSRKRVPRNNFDRAGTKACSAGSKFVNSSSNGTMDTYSRPEKAGFGPYDETVLREVFE